jgi:xanthine/uracil permease
MNAGFLAFAVAMPIYAVSLRAALPGATWLVALANGVATAAIAAAPLGHSPSIDTAHAAAAGAAYVTLAALPLAAATPLARTGRPRVARASVVLGLVAGASLAATSADRAVGLFQRAGLTLVDAWIVASALAMLRKRP